jgi:hypothetical protein
METRCWFPACGACDAWAEPCVADVLDGVGERVGVGVGGGAGGGGVGVWVGVWVGVGAGAGHVVAGLGAAAAVAVGLAWPVTGAHVVGGGVGCVGLGDGVAEEYRGDGADGDGRGLLGPGPGVVGPGAIAGWLAGRFGLVWCISELIRAARLWRSPGTPTITAAATSTAAAVASTGRSQPPLARRRCGTVRSQPKSRPKPRPLRAGLWAILLRIRSRPSPDGTTLSAAARNARRRRSP